MRIVFAVCLTVMNAVAASAQPAVRCVDDLRTTNNCYKLYEPRQKPRGLVVLLPGYGDTVDFFDDVRLPELMRGRGYLVATFSMAGYVTWENDIGALHTVLTRIIEQHPIPSQSLAIVGFSAGGTGAIRYAEYCIEKQCARELRPAAAVSVDGPLDFERWHRCAVRKADRQPDNPSGAMIVKVLAGALGGSPGERRETYVKAAPLTVTERYGGNARLLKDTAVRAYTEPDIVWTINQWSNDYYCTNAIDQAALVQELRYLGNGEAELILTSGKGYRRERNEQTGKYARTERSPHSWTIVDERELADWIERHIGSGAAKRAR